MKNRLARLTVVLASATLAVVSTSFAGPADLGLPLGHSLVGTSSAERCGVFASLLDADSSLSRFAVGAIGGLGHPQACDQPDAFPMQAAARVDRSFEAARRPPALVEGDLRVVRARVGARGAIELAHNDSAAAVAIAPEVLRIVARELAFPQQLRRGTPLELVVESRSGRLVALRLGTGLSAKHAFYFRSEVGSGEGFFARDGRSMEHRFLRYPLAFDLITSPFGRRVHPVLRKVRHHNGVDFAARSGTPVLAIGSGTVTEARWDGRYGRTVTIEHEDGYTSLYAHLQQFARGLREGAQVRKGQVIGYVGTSGLTTGPHLHFSIVKNGVYIDPLGQLPKRPAVDTAALGAFRVAVARAELALSDARRVVAPALASASNSSRRPL